jgi:predicted ABC-class ATPase
MIRDDKMARLVATDKEPITPFVRVVRSIYEERGISTILVIGGAGDYFDVADHVLLMDCYKCEDATERAQKIVADCVNMGAPPVSSIPSFGANRYRYPIISSLSPNGRVKVTRKGIISYGETELNLTGLEQIVSRPQTNGISAALQKIASTQLAKSTVLYDTLRGLDVLIDNQGLNGLAPGQFHGALTRPRLLEIAGAINRLRHSGSIEQR